MEQKIIEIDTSPCGTSFRELRDKTIIDMSRKGFRLLSTSILHGKECNPYAHGTSYSTNDKLAMLFEK